MPANLCHKEKRYLWIAFFAFYVSVLFFFPGKAQAQNLDEYAVKAAFSLNFAKFTLWPVTAFNDPSSPIELCVFGDTNTRKAFASIEGKPVGARKLHVRFLELKDSADTCHMMFIGKSVGRAHQTQLITTTGGRPVMAIGETPNFIQSGGSINIFREKNRFLFEINPSIIKEQNLKLSSRLLKLAIIVGGK